MIKPGLAGLATGNASAPSFTSADVVQFVATAPLGFGRIVAEVSGDFSVSQPPPAPMHTLYLVFDARSGEILTEEVGP